MNANQNNGITEQEVNEIIALLMSRDEEDFILANNMMEVMHLELADSIVNIMNEESPDFNFCRGHLYNLVRVRGGLYKQLKNHSRIYNHNLDLNMINKAIGEIYGNTRTNTADAEE